MSAIRQELVASAAQVASGNSASFRLSTVTQVAVGVDVTAGSGTSPQLDVWLEVSDDGGTTWYEMPADQVLKSTGTATPGTVGTNQRNIVDAKTTTAAEKFLGVFKHLAADYVRLRWTISGTSPSFTFSASLVGK